MQKFECNGCGGHLKEDGRFWVCESCGTKYVLGRNDEGDPFTYQPIEKKQIEFGRMAVKASQIKTESIAVKAIKLSESIDVDVHKESTNIELQQNIQIITRFLNAKEWDAAQDQINQILISDCNNAEAHWYGWMCDKHISSEDKLINSFYMFTQADATKLDDILSNASPAFAKHIIELLFDKAYLNDNMCFSIMSVVLPYAKNEAVLSEQEYKLKTSNALDVVVLKLYPNSFEYLLRSTLSENDVDLYISCLQKFGDKCAPASAQKYYSEILKVDPGNMAIHKKLILADIKANSTVEKCISDFENLLKYSDNADAEVLYFFDFINSNKTTSANISQFVWQLIGYHSGAPEALKTHIINYSRILLQSSLWEQAKRNLQLILSFEPQNAYVYWLLCLVKLQARNESEIKYKKDNLIDCPEFKKSLALYQSSGNKQTATELLSYTKHQKTIKKVKKAVLYVALAIILIVVGMLAVEGLGKLSDFIELKRITAYKEASSLLSGGQYEDAYKTFADLGDYKDSKSQAQFAKDALDRINKENEELRIRYEAAIQLYEAGDYEGALAEFKELQEYEDSVSYASQCQDQINEKQYSQALLLYNAGRYEEASSAFAALKGYKDSKSMITACDNAILERKYSEALDLLEEKQYENAMKAFKELNGYKDSNNKTKECNEALAEIKYQSALDAYDNSKYEEALALFKELGDYKDSESYMSSSGLKCAKIGDTVIFGKYEQDNVANGYENIEWIVLDSKDGKLLLLSKHILDWMQYSEQSASSSHWKYTTWEYSDVRKWLNDEFLNAAFSPEEQEHILLSKIEPDEELDLYYLDMGRIGNETNDYLFLLGLTEYSLYCTTKETLEAVRTEYAYNKAQATAELPGWTTNDKWWLRFRTTDRVGVITGSYLEYDGASTYAGVRPAIWITIS